MIKTARNGFEPLFSLVTFLITPGGFLKPPGYCYGYEMENTPGVYEALQGYDF
jgi:hypothetical protein